MKGAQVGRHALQEEIDLAREHVAIAHDGRAPRPLLEGDQIGFGLAVQPDHGEGRHVEAERLVVQDRGEAFDDPGLLQRTHATQAGRRGDPHLAGEIDIGDAAVGLKFTQNPPVGGIEAG